MSNRIYQMDSGIISIPASDAFYAVVTGPPIPLSNLASFSVISGSAGAWDPDPATNVGAALSSLLIPDVSLYMLFLDSTGTMIEFICLASIAGPSQFTGSGASGLVGGNGLNAVMPSPTKITLPMSILGKGGYPTQIQFQSAADLINVNAGGAQHAEVNGSLILDY